MARKPSQEPGDTQATIRAAAFRLFGRYGYDGVSVADIAAAANVTKPAMYWHFKNKDDLYRQSLLDLMALFRAYVFAPMAEYEDPAEQVLAMFDGAARLLTTPEIAGGVAGYWMDPSTSIEVTSAAVLQEFEDEAERFLLAVLTRGIELGAFRATLPPAAVAETVIALLEAVVLPLRLHGDARTRRVAGSLAYHFFATHAADPTLAERAYAALVDTAAV